MSQDDPTVALFYNAPPNLGEPQKDPTHTSNFGVKLKEHCESTGTVCELIHPGAKSSKYPTPTDFLIETPTNKGKKPNSHYSRTFCLQALTIRKLSDRQPTPRLCVNRNAKVHRRKTPHGNTCSDLHQDREGESHVVVTDFDPFKTTALHSVNRHDEMYSILRISVPPPGSIFGNCPHRRTSKHSVTSC